jgi:ABC-type multidrug transport system fused ATPase/permease subunit
MTKKGTASETGTHNELMSRSTRYRFMVELQTHPLPPPSRLAM